MKVYVIRHGQSEGNRTERNCGWSATPLSELGHQQARRAGELLQGVSFDRVFCSDLVRTRQTAQDALPGVKPEYTDLIREVSVGTLADRYIADNAAQYGEAYWDSVRRQDFSAYGGETQAQICRRVRRFIRQLEELEGAERVAVFGHEGTVHQFLNYVLGADIPLEHLHIANASVTVFSYENGVWPLEKFSHTGPLA